MRDFLSDNDIPFKLTTYQLFFRLFYDLFFAFVCIENVD